MARSITIALVLLVAAVSASPVAPAAEMAKREAPTPVEKREGAVVAAISPRPWKRDLLGDVKLPGIAVPAVITPRPWKREDDSSSSSPVEQRDVLGDVLEKIGLAGSDDDDDDGAAPKPGRVHADVATPRGWKRGSEVATPKGWVKEKREPLAEAAANEAVMQEQKRGAAVASGKGWKRDAMPTPRPFVS